MNMENKILEVYEEDMSGECYMCGEPADKNWWYRQPGDFDGNEGDNLASLIHLCDECSRDYPRSYPEKLYIVE